MPNYRAAAAAAARRYGIDPGIFTRQIGQESGFNPGAVSSAGARGIAQFMPSTARGLGINPDNPMQALDAAAKMDAANLKKYGNWQDVLSLYNSGRGWSQGQKIGETNNYVKSILGGSARIPAGTVPLTGKGVDVSPALAKAIPGTSARQALVAGLLSSLGSFSRTGKVDPNALSGVLSHIQELRGSARATFVADDDAGPVHDPQGMISEAKKWLGTPYSWGGGGTKGPSRGTGRGANTVGFDCSSFIQYLWGKKGVSIPRTTYEQFKTGHPVAPNQLQPGDAVFFDPTSQGPGHVGMYIGNGQYIQAPHTGDVVKISNLASARNYVGARRY